MLIVFALVFAYTYSDVATGSTSYNYAGTSRTVSHILLALTILCIVICAMLFKTKEARGYGPYMPILLAMAGWTAFNCLVFRTPIWTAATYVGFTVWWMFTFLLMKRYCAEDLSDMRFVIALCMLMLAFYVYEFVDTFNYANSVVDKEYAVLNIVFRVLVFVPLIMLMRNGLLKNVLMALIAVLVCASLKRAALIAYPLMLLVYVLVDGKIKGQPLNSFFRLVLLFALIMLVFAVADRYFGGYISVRFSEEQLEYGSGRIMRWTEAAEDIHQRGFMEFLVGSGIGSAGYAQHNEWIEQMYSFGLVGFLLDMFFAIRLVSVFGFYYKKKSPLAAPYAALIMYFLVVGMVSGFMYMHSTLYLFIFAGICESRHPFGGVERVGNEKD